MYRDIARQPPELCIECPAVAIARCPRCADPCCSAHRYSVDRTCLECETERQRRAEPSRLLNRAVVGTCGASLVGSLIFGAGFLMMGVLVFGAALAISFISYAWERRHFLDEKRGKAIGRLAAPPDCR